MQAISIDIEKLSKKLGATQALTDITAQFEAGKVFGVIGPNGAGKTTLMRIMAQLLKPTIGQVNYYCREEKLSLEEVKIRTAYFPQEPSLYPDLSVEEHLDFFADLYNLSKDKYYSRKEELLRATGMAPFTKRVAGKLSGGMYKKLGLMCVLINRPNILLLDEPTIGVDPISRRQLWDLIYQFAGQDMTVIINTSYMDEAQRCYEVLVLDKGKTLAQGTAKEIMSKFKVEHFTDIFLKYGQTDK